MRVLLAYDGSAGATQAVGLAEAIAWPSDTAFRVVNVVEPALMSAAGSWDAGAILTPEVDTAITAYARGIMHEVVEGSAVRACPWTAKSCATAPLPRSSMLHATSGPTW